jgi:hypothetical protein
MHIIYVIGSFCFIKTTLPHFFDRKETGRKADCEPKPKPFCLWQKPQKAKCAELSMASNQAETPRPELRSLIICTCSTYRLDK